MTRNKLSELLNAVLLAAMVCCLSLFPLDAFSQDHDDHDHDNHQQHEDHHEADSDIEPKDQQSDGGHQDEQHELEVELSDKAVKIAAIALAKVESRNIDRVIELAGEVDFDQEKIAHVVPRFPGIVLAADKKVGDSVKAGAVLASIESNESLNKYQIKSLLSGTVIEKHITRGEFVSEGSTIFVIADLSQVWVNLEVYAKDAEQLKLGQKVSIETVGNHQRAEGVISYIKPVYSEQTRSLIARVVLPNSEKSWRPGAFVRGLVSVQAQQPVNVVSKDAVQIIKNKNYLFVPEAGAKNVFRAVEVEIGQGDRQHVQILSGLSSGDQYVVKGAFELKAELATGSLTGHAGHGH